MSASPGDAAVGTLPRRAEAPKAYFHGTHRSCTPETTWQRIEPVLDVVGITRVADITWLDDLGVPVAQAVEAGARTVSVSQGKGATATAARVSAAMEAIEVWHAEQLPPGPLVASIAELESTLGYRVDQLRVERRSFIAPSTTLDWHRAVHLDGNETPTWLPSACLALDGRVRQCWTPPTFVATSNGLASGNSPAEAAVHAIYEVIERDAVASARAAGPLPTVSGEIGGLAGGLIDQIRSRRGTIRLHIARSGVGVPCFVAYLSSHDHPVVYVGSGAHLDIDVAACRAVTEAAQSRLTAIAGAREDIAAAVYRGRASSTALDEPYPGPEIPFADLKSDDRRDFHDELLELAARIQRLTSNWPLLVDHTRPDVGVPVVRVVCPGLDCPSDY